MCLDQCVILEFNHNPVWFILQEAVFMIKIAEMSSLKEFRTSCGCHQIILLWSLFFFLRHCFCRDPTGLLAREPLLPSSLCIFLKQTEPPSKHLISLHSTLKHIDRSNEASVFAPCHKQRANHAGEPKRFWNKVFIWVFPYTKRCSFLRKLTQIIGISIGALQLRFLDRASSGHVQ